MAQLKRGENRTIAQIQEDVLTAFEETGNITLACKKARMVRRTFYNWIKADAAFAEAFEESRIMAIGVLEDEAQRRAVHGVKKGVYYKGRRVGWQVEYSDALLTLLLKAHSPELYKDRSATEHSGPNGTPIESKTEVITRVIFEDYAEPDKKE